MTTLRSIAVLGVVLSACGSMSTMDAGTGGGGGSAATGGGSSATGGGGGSSGGGGGTGGGSGVIQVNCTDFPTTIPLGDTISPNDKAVVICNSTQANFCRVTNNTYSDGCGDNDDFMLAQDLTTGVRRLYIRDQQMWTFVSKTHGDASPGGMYEFRNLPADTDMTFVFSTGGANYEVKFKFVGTTAVVTKVGPP